MKSKLTALIGLVVLNLWFVSFALGADNSSWKYGLDIRLREEYLINVLDLNDNTGKDDNYLRFKVSPWLKYDASKDVGIMLKLTTEPKYFFISGDYGKGKQWTSKEMVFDSLYLDYKNAFGAPIDFRIGRQDFLGTYGEGFVIMDGTPGDGSRTYYFNAMKGTWRINPNNSVDLVYINDFKEDEMPVLNANQHVQTNNSDEQGIVLYGKSKLSDKFTLEPYYIWKREDGSGTTPILKLNTIGSRAVYAPDPWKFRGELAGQFGEYNGGADREGLGGYLIVGRKFNEVCMTPEFNLGYYYLSGDKPNTAKNEGWDPLFSRYPWLSELYAYTLAKESKIAAYWSNLQAYRASVKFDITEKTNLTLWYNYLLANENVSGSMFSNDGKVRGQLPQIQLNHKFNKNLDGYILVEELFPGSFYADSAQDNTWFFRWQLQYKFSS